MLVIEMQDKSVLDAKEKNFINLKKLSYFAYLRSSLEKWDISFPFWMVSTQIRIFEAFRDSVPISITMKNYFDVIVE